MLTVRRPIIGIERRQGSPAPSRQEVFLAERRRQLAQFVSRTRMSPGQVTKVTQHQEEVVGKETSPRKVIVITNGHGQVSVHKDKDPLHLAPVTRSKWPSTCAATVGKTVGGRSRCPAFASTGLTQHRKLEAGMEIAHR